MVEERLLLDEKQMDDLLRSIAKKIVGDGYGEAVLVGIQSRGVPLAHWLAKHVTQFAKKSPPVGTLDINLYRDDLSEVSDQPVVRKTDFPFTVQGADIILVDDVLYTGRTIRAALDCVIDYGRPKRIQLAVLIDRGWRELPIQADYTGKTVKTKAEEVIKVMTKEFDGKNCVVVKSDFSKRF
ncbi:MAG: bifunctional pyr operon transcriptional regulator/uracil phosphoribosyltransferase PyrR [Deltaproteobacteria bacterium]|nr:bifunctional pyr operon transcriptional regulator/uracil phosphoribosyltransferase PyrR [Deltaproteobacteria bacterium]